MEQIEHNIEELNKVVNRHMLTDIEVQLTNEVIRLNEKIKLYKIVVDMIDEYIHNNKLYYEDIDYDYEENPYLSSITDEYAVRDLEKIIAIVKKGSEDDIQSREPR